MTASPGITIPRAASSQPVPNWEHELHLYSQGHTLLAGVDEAGRGAWAGPLVAGAVILPHPAELLAASGVNIVSEITELRDSKMLSAATREKLLVTVRSVCVAVGVGVVSPALIDLIGLGVANRLAMARAVRDLGVWPHALLIDAFRLPTMPLPQRPIIKGDACCMSIAAASIVAKVTRDHIMEACDAEYPGYSFAKHKGYGTRLHVEAILRHGVLPMHRRSYAPIKAILAGLPWRPPHDTDVGDTGEG